MLALLGAGSACATESPADCAFSDVSATLSPRIATVGIVTWATSLPGVTAAHVDFGLTTAYGMTAPVDLRETDRRTLLLGMKPARTYHYRIVASSAGGTCESSDHTVTSGAKPGGPVITVTTTDASRVAGGFLIFAHYPQSGASIIDGDGDVVWSFDQSVSSSGVQMSHDGKALWINSDNCCTDGGASVHRVSMDGLADDDLSREFSGQNHQLAVLPDETVAFYGYGERCDDIKERSPAGRTRTIVNSGTAQGVTDGCHINNVAYSRADDTLVFSDLDHATVTKVRRTGETVWVLNGAQGFGGLWQGGQHGIDVLGLDDILIFNNGDGNSGALQLKLDLANRTATTSWSHSGPVHVDFMGDAVRLPNGNTLIAYSNRGLTEEVTSDGTVVQTMRWSSGSFGYVEKRVSLYGPPLR